MHVIILALVITLNGELDPDLGVSDEWKEFAPAQVDFHRVGLHNREIKAAPLPLLRIQHVLKQLKLELSVFYVY